MKAFISVDLEGLPHIVAPAHLNLRGSLYSEARKIATQLTIVTAQTLHENGFDEVIIADSHGPMVNLIVDGLPEYCQIVRGTPRPTSMVSGIETCDCALFIGYHAKFGTAYSTFDHTYSSASIQQLSLNGIPVSEYLLNAYIAGEYNIPVILAAGDAALLSGDITTYTPWVEKVTLKHSLSRLAAISPSMVKIEQELVKSTQTAIKNFSEQKTKPFVATKPIEMSITFLASHFADVAELLPKSTRVDGLKIKYSADNMVEAYKVFQLLVSAAQGVRATMDYLQ